MRLLSLQGTVRPSTCTEGIAGLKTRPGGGRKAILDDQADLAQVRTAVQNHRQKMSLAKSELETGLSQKV